MLAITANTLYDGSQMATNNNHTIHPVFADVIKHFVQSNGYSEITRYERNMYPDACESLENPQELCVDCCKKFDAQDMCMYIEDGKEVGVCKGCMEIERQEAAEELRQLAADLNSSAVAQSIRVMSEVA